MTEADRGMKEIDEGFIVTDDDLLDIVKPLTNLIPEWRARLKGRSVKIDFAIQIGIRLEKESQWRFLEFLSDHVVLEKQKQKVLHAFALDMPEWSIHALLRIYKLAEETRSAIVMINDRMDEYEVIYRQLEYEFWEGHFPTEEDKLEQALQYIEGRFQALYRQSSAGKKSDYNRTYGDSSTMSNHVQSPWSGIPFHTVIGVEEAAPDEEVRKQSRRLLKKLHPDRGGSAYLFNWFKQAYDAYRFKVGE